MSFAVQVKSVTFSSKHNTQGRINAEGTLNAVGFTTISLG